MTVNDEPKIAGVFVRSVAKSLDLLFAMALNELVPRIGFPFALLYILFADGFYGRASIGKKLFGLFVKPLHAKRDIPIRDSILRNIIIAAAFVLWKMPIIGWLFFMIILIVEFIIMFGSRDSMRIGDQVAATRVYELKKHNQ